MQLTEDAVGEVLTVTDRHERKAEMARQADAFIALPGITYIPCSLILFFFDLLNELALSGMH